MLPAFQNPRSMVGLPLYPTYTYPWPTTTAFAIDMAWSAIFSRRSFFKLAAWPVVAVVVSPQLPSFKAFVKGVSSSYPLLSSKIPGIGDSYPSIFASPHCSSTAQARHNQQQPERYSIMTPPPSYPFLTVPISGIASRFSPTRQAHQITPLPTQQQYMTMSPPSYPLMTASMPSIRQARQTIQQPTNQYYTTTPPTAVNMVSHSTLQNSKITPDHQIVVSGRLNHHYQDTIPSLKSRSCPGQTGLSSSANHSGRSFALQGRTHIANSSNVNTATCSSSFAAGPSSHVANMSTILSSGASNGSETAEAAYFSTYKNHTQSNDSMTYNTAQPQFPTTTSIPSNDSVPLMPNNAPGPQNTYTHSPAINMNRYKGYDFPFYNPPSLHSAQYHNTVTENVLLPSSLPLMPYSPQHFSPNSDLAPPSPHPKSFAHDFGTQHGSGPPALSMAPSPHIYPRPDLPHRNSLSRPSSKRRRKTRKQETQPSPSAAFSCDWLDKDNTLCEFKGLQDDLNEHFTSTHLSGAQDALGRCHWRGCQYRKRTNPNVHDMRRDSMWRHVRERHLNIKRIKRCI